jgi:hypothetical protein
MSKSLCAFCFGFKSQLDRMQSASLKPSNANSSNSIKIKNSTKKITSRHYMRVFIFW